MPRRRPRPLLFILLAAAIAAGLFLVLRPCADLLLRRPTPAPPGPRDTTAGQPLDPALAARLEPLLQVWLDRWQATQPGFNLSRLRSTFTYPLLPARPEGEASPAPPAAELRRREQLGFISYSPDRSRYVDRNTYAVIVVAAGDTSVESEPDQLVELVDLRRNERTRLAFHGTASSTDEVRWLDDSTIVLCGSGEDPSSTRQRRLPELRLVQLGRKTVMTYSLP
ncbi:MAG: hypothetical protein ABIK37_02715 [candidate division WOR-3 bacterium]